MLFYIASYVGYNCLNDSEMSVATINLRPTERHVMVKYNVHGAHYTACGQNDSECSYQRNIHKNMIYVRADLDQIYECLPQGLSCYNFKKQICTLILKHISKFSVKNTDMTVCVSFLHVLLWYALYVSMNENENRILPSPYER